MTVRLGDDAPSDEALMVRVGADDSIAFAELYRRHVDRAFRVARAVGLDAGGAEDAIDSAFATLWRRRADFRPELGSFRAWAMTVVQNHARDLARDEEPRDRPCGLPVANPSAGHRDNGEAVAPLRLPEPLAEIVILAFHGELHRDEIATHLDLARHPTTGRMRLAAGVRVPDRKDDGSQSTAPPD